MEDVINLYKLKEMIFILKDIASNYLLQARLNGIDQAPVQKDIFQKHSSFVLDVVKKVMTGK